jgi:hypothetical protein
MGDSHKNVIDVLSVSSLLAWFIGVLPTISLLLTVAWLMMRMVEGTPKVLDAVSDLRDRWNRRSLK